MLSSMRTLVTLAVFISLSAWASPAFARSLTLADKGEARCVIVVPPETMAWDGDDRQVDHWGRISGSTALEVEAEMQRRLQRDSVRDLAHYLGRMSGAESEIVEALPARDRRTPIFIGAAAEKVFGPVGITKAGKFGFRVVADPRRGIGLYGESGYGTSYAIYELLHRLGCRWFIPSEMGECIPDTPILNVPVMDEKLAPATEWRRMENRTADPDFRRRNRLGGSSDGGNVISANHALPLALKWWSEAEANAVADEILARLDKNYVSSVSLSPHDGVMPTEDPEGLKYDPAPRVWEPAAGRWSTTDRAMMLCNRVAKRVGEKYPDVLFGFLAYVNYSMPPAREPVHPNVIPMIAPIDFNRHHPMNWPDHPNKSWLLDMVKGWGAKASRLAYYAYGMNLAELSAPNPFITKWGTDLRILMENHLTYWAPETMGGWESMMPGFYLSIRMTFYPEEKPDDILEDLWTRFYGAAAEPMGRYWRHIDRAWIDAREYSGCGFGYLRIFTPEVMAEARSLINQALKKCETIPEYRRVQMIDESLTLFELFMKMREDFAAGRLQHLERDLNQWRGSIRHLARRYRPQFAFDSGLALEYVNGFWGAAYEDASRMERDFARHGAPMLEWKYRHNPGPEADSLPWTAPDYHDKDWPTTHVVRETWSTLGHHNTMTDAASGRSGRMAYRATQPLGALPEGKRAFLWIGSTDGSAKLFVNGQHVKYVVPKKTRWHEAGAVIDAFSGYCQPALFDITAAVKPGANQLTILCERAWLNELGTGGLMGPVVIYREK